MKTISTISNWEQLGQVSPQTLTNARLQLHWASQIVAAVGNALIPPESDDSHTNLEWSPALQALQGNPLPDGKRVALQLESLELVLVAAAGQIVQAIVLPGKTLQDGLDTVGSWLGTTLNLRDYEMPEHATANGDSFSLDETESCRELGRWYANADTALRSLREQQPGDPVRCWPHHFDIATLLRIERGERSEGIVGVGMTPGDHNYAEPYWYVSAWQKPDNLDLPDLPTLPSGGFWRPEGWFGAVLTAVDLVQHGEGQAEALAAFLQTGVEASIQIVQAAE